MTRLRKNGWIAIIALCLTHPTYSQRLPVLTEAIAVPNPATMLLRDPKVHRELELRVEQRAAIEPVLAEVELGLWLLRDVPPTSRANRAKILIGKLEEQLDRTLSVRQIERFGQIVLQANGVRGILSASVRRRLGLKAGQIRQVQALLERSEKDLQELSRKESKDAQTDNTRRIRTLVLRDVVAVLSLIQRQYLGDMMGRPFDLSQVRNVACRAPELTDVTNWVNSDPLTLAQMRGKVVILHFYTYGCINCIRNLPHYNQWREDYPAERLAIVGIHRPETKGEHSVEKVREKAIAAQMKCPIAVDNESRNWDVWANHIWPSVYLIDKNGFVRYWWYGELNFKGIQGEKRFRNFIEQLLKEPVAGNLSVE